MQITNTELVASSWTHAFALARQHGHSASIKIPKYRRPYLPSRFEKSRLSFRKGANQVYRDTNAKNSFQIREYDDYWTVSLDHFNPEQGHLVEHAVRDAPVQTALGLLAVAAIGFGGN